MKKSIFALCLIALLFCGCGNKGDKILIVEIAEKNADVSDVSLVKEALTRGGMIVISVDIARQIDSEFDEKYTTSGNSDSFLITPALLNFVGGNGWSFVQTTVRNEYFFVRNRK